MIYGYIRVSTDKQTLENQRHIILNYCEVNGLHIDGWIEETISGTKAPDKRKLGQLLRHVQPGDTIRVLIEQDNSYAELARLFHVDRSTMKRFCDARDIKRPFSRNATGFISVVAE